MIVGQIGEYRELSLEELRAKFGRQAREIQASELQAKKQQAKSIVEMFAEALSCLEDTVCHFRDIDKQYDEMYPNDECAYPEMHFWLALEDAIKPLGRIQEGLKAVEPLAPKEET